MRLLPSALPELSLSFRLAPAQDGVVAGYRFSVIYLVDVELHRKCTCDPREIFWKVVLFYPTHCSYGSDLSTLWDTRGSR